MFPEQCQGGKVQPGQEKPLSPLALVVPGCAQGSSPCSHICPFPGCQSLLEAASPHNWLPGTGMPVAPSHGFPFSQKAWKPKVKEVGGNPARCHPGREVSKTAAVFNGASAARLTVLLPERQSRELPVSAGVECYGGGYARARVRAAPMLLLFQELKPSCG